jgi:hypothetical protein
LSVDPARLAEGLRYVEVAKSRYMDDTYMARVMYGETSSMVFEIYMTKDGMIVKWSSVSSAFIVSPRALRSLLQFLEEGVEKFAKLVDLFSEVLHSYFKQLEASDQPVSSGVGYAFTASTCHNTAAFIPHVRFWIGGQWRLTAVAEYGFYFSIMGERRTRDMWEERGAVKAALAALKEVLELSGEVDRIMSELDESNYVVSSLTKGVPIHEERRLIRGAKRVA